MSGDDTPPPPTTGEFWADIKAHARERGVLVATRDLLWIGVIALFILGPELPTLLWCRLTGREYRPPAVRLVDEIEADHADADE